jgi:ABC-type nickel/cobalt efflux system permease component RcnA
MSVTAEPLSPLARGSGLLLRRLVVAGLAVATVAGALALLAWWLAPGAPPAPVRAPFGLGMREAAPQASGIGATILVLQGSFYRSLQAAVSALKESGAAFWSLLALGFAYGVFHAAGPGHGKAVIAGYLVANERALAKGFGLSLAAAIVQAVVAVALVGILALLLQSTAATMGRVTSGIEWASFAAVALLGAVLTWRKAGKLAGLSSGTPVAACDHIHLPPPEAFERMGRFREMAAVVLAAGMRPCAGAIVVLVFALSQSAFAAGIAAVIAMAIGTALTTGIIAAAAVFAKTLALRLAGGRGAGGEIATASIELLAAALVLVLGLMLLVGMWSAAGS